MAEEKKPQRKPRKIPDAGQRMVLQGIEVPLLAVIQPIARARGLKVKNLEEAERDKGLKATIELIRKANGAEDAHEDSVVIWVPLGQVKAEEREEAILKVLGGEVPGDYRAPNASAWRGGKRYKVPAQVALEVENLD